VRELNADHCLTGRVVLERLAALGQHPKIYKYVVWDAEVERSFGFTNREAQDDVSTTAEILHTEDISEYLEQKFAAFLKHETQTSFYSASQTRTVVPPSLIERVKTQNFEEFWVPSC